MKGSFLCQGKVLILMYIYFQLPAFPISIPIISYPDLTLSNLRQGDLGTIFPHFSFQRYGDKCPRGVVARLFGITWTLSGLVVMAILTGTIATALTGFGVEGPYISLYGTKVSFSS